MVRRPKTGRSVLTTAHEVMTARSETDAPNREIVTLNVKSFLLKDVRVSRESAISSTGTFQRYPSVSNGWSQPKIAYGMSLPFQPTFSVSIQSISPIHDYR